MLAEQRRETHRNVGRVLLEELNESDNNIKKWGDSDFDPLPFGATVSYSDPENEKDEIENRLRKEVYDTVHSNFDTLKSYYEEISEALSECASNYGKSVASCVDELYSERSKGEFEYTDKIIQLIDTSFALVDKPRDEKQNARSKFMMSVQKKGGILQSICDEINNIVRREGDDADWEVASFISDLIKNQNKNTRAIADAYARYMEYPSVSTKRLLGRMRAEAEEQDNRDYFSLADLIEQDTNLNTPDIVEPLIGIYNVRTYGEGLCHIAIMRFARYKMKRVGISEILDLDRFGRDRI